MPVDKETLALAVRDRTLVILTIITLIVGLILIASTLLQVRPTDVQVPVRFSAYGVTNLYRDKWYYLLSFLGMGLLLIAQPAVTLKLLQEKGREFAVAFALGTVVVGVIGVMLTQALLRVVSISL